MRKYAMCWAFLLLVVFLLLPGVRAQVTTGTILGTVRDNTGATVGGAKVTITETGKGTSADHVTDDTGSFSVPFLVPGTYSVSVEKEGFKKQVRDGVILQVDQKARVDFTVEVGAVTETVSVVAAAPLVKTDSSELGEVIEERAVRELPLNGRNFAQLVYLAPGVTAGQVGENLSGQSTFNPRAGSNFNALGHHGNSNGWLVDGIDNNEYTFNTVIVQPSIESVREFKVLTGVYSAEFGRGAGVVSVSTKSGSNDLHGNLFGFLRHRDIQARNYFDPGKSAFTRVQAGATLLVVAPCCQKELRPQLTAAPVLASALRHGIFQERHAEFATDALRALLLEWAGYDTKVFEFISTEHTAKNLMIAASRRPGGERSDAAATRVRELASFYGVKSQALARQLGFML